MGAQRTHRVTSATEGNSAAFCRYCAVQPDTRSFDCYSRFETHPRAIFSAMEGAVLGGVICPDSRSLKAVSVQHVMRFQCVRCPRTLASGRSVVRFAERALAAEKLPGMEAKSFPKAERSEAAEFGSNPKVSG